MWPSPIRPTRPCSAAPRPHSDPEHRVIPSRLQRSSTTRIRSISGPKCRRGTSPHASQAAQEDGAGHCACAKLAAGRYVVQEAAAPAGYAAGPDYAAELEPGGSYTATFVNLKAVGRVEIALTDDAESPRPLPGAGFDLVVDN